VDKLDELKYDVVIPMGEFLHFSSESFKGKFLIVMNQGGIDLGTLSFQGLGNKAHDYGNGYYNLDAAYIFETLKDKKILLPVPDVTIAPFVEVKFFLSKSGELVLENEDDSLKEYLTFRFCRDGAVYVISVYDDLYCMFIDEFDDNELIVEKEIENVSSRVQSASGGDLAFNGFIDGHEICGFTRRVLGKSHYGIWNEDSAGVDFSNGRVVIADGIGGGIRGDLASYLTVSTVLDSSLSLRGSIFEAHQVLVDFNSFIRTFDSFNDSDCAVIAAEFNNGVVDVCALGDSSWMLIRDGEIVRKNVPHSVLNEKLQNVNAFELYSQNSTEYFSLQRQLTVTLLMNSNKKDDILVDTGDYQFDIKLRKGDVFVMGTDGIFDNLSDDEVIFFCSSELSTRSIVEVLYKRISDKNNSIMFKIGLLDSNGERQNVDVRAAEDNGTLVVYRY